jgi:hypothetical protein
MGAELGCCESRKVESGDETPRFRRPPKSAPEGEEPNEPPPRGDIEVWIGDEPMVTDLIRSLAGDYWEEGKHNGRPLYRNKGRSLTIYYKITWCIGTAVDSASPILLADIDEDQIPRKGWQTPKSLFRAPQEVPVLIRNLKAKKPRKKPAGPSAFTKAVQPCFQGCGSFLEHLADRSPPWCKPCLRHCHATKESVKKKDVSKSLKETIDEGYRLARSASEELSNLAKEGLPEIKKSLDSSKQAVRRKTGEFGTMFKESSSRHVGKAGIAITSARKISSADVKQTYRGMKDSLYHLCEPEPATKRIGKVEKPEKVEDKWATVSINILRDRSENVGFEFDPATLKITTFDEERPTQSSMKVGDTIIAVNDVLVTDSESYFQEVANIPSFKLTLRRDKVKEEAAPSSTTGSTAATTDSEEVDIQKK